eukprot:1158063-Pelagomonas_calceolata.AAC.7
MCELILHTWGPAGHGWWQGSEFMINAFRGGYLGGDAHNSQLPEATLRHFFSLPPSSTPKITAPPSEGIGGCCEGNGGAVAAGAGAPPEALAAAAAAAAESECERARGWGGVGEHGWPASGAKRTAGVLEEGTGGIADVQGSA